MNFVINPGKTLCTKREAIKTADELKGQKEQEEYKGMFYQFNAYCINEFLFYIKCQANPSL